MATTTVDQGDRERLESLLRELLDAGRSEEAATVARDHSLVQELVYSDLLTTPDDDAEFIRETAEAGAVIAAGRLVPHLLTPAEEAKQQAGGVAHRRHEDDDGRTT